MKSSKLKSLSFIAISSTESFSKNEDEPNVIFKGGKHHSSAYSDDPIIVYNLNLPAEVEQNYYEKKNSKNNSSNKNHSRFPSIL